MLKRLIPLILSVFILVGCGKGGTENQGGRRVDKRKPLAWGHEQTIYAFADEKVWTYAEQHLRNSIERFFFTTENETYFDLKRTDIANIDQFYRFKNLIFLADLQSEEPVARYVKNRLSQNALESVKENGVGMFTLNNLWANDQFVVFLLGNDEEMPLRYNILQANEIFEKFKEVLFDRIGNRIFGGEVFSDSYFEAFPWKMKIPQSYIEYKRGNRFVSFLHRRKEKPDKYISVYYEDIPEEQFNREWLKATRAKIAWDYYDEDEFSSDDIRQQNYKLNNIAVLRMDGRWQNRKYMIGGAFSSFAFYRDNKAFLIDNSVFYPQGYKLPALIELEVISRTIN